MNHINRRFLPFSGLMLIVLLLLVSATVCDDSRSAVEIATPSDAKAPPEIVESTPFASPTTPATPASGDAMPSVEVATTATEVPASTAAPALPAASRTYGSEVFIAGTIEEFAILVDGTWVCCFPKDTLLAANRHIFYSEEPILKPAQVVASRTVTTECGLLKNSIGAITTKAPSGEILEVLYPRPSELAYTCAFRAPDDTILSSRQEVEVISHDVLPAANPAEALNLSLQSFIPPPSLEKGNTWNLPPARVSALLEKPPGLIWTPLDRDFSTWPLELTPGAFMTREHLGGLTGLVEIVPRGQSAGGLGNDQRAGYKFDLRSVSEDHSILTDFAQVLSGYGGNVVRSCKIELDLRGIGSVYCSGKLQTPQLELHLICKVSLVAELTSAESNRIVEMRYSFSGNLAYLGGGERRTELPWDEMWSPEERFLDWRSFGAQHQ